MIDVPAATALIALAAAAAAAVATATAPVIGAAAGRGTPPRARKLLIALPMEPSEHRCREVVCRRVGITSHLRHTKTVSSSSPSSITSVLCRGLLTAASSSGTKVGLAATAADATIEDLATRIKACGSDADAALALLFDGNRALGFHKHGRLQPSPEWDLEEYKDSEMQRHATRRHVSAAIAVCGRAGRWEDAMSLYETVAHFADPPIDHAMINALKRCSRSAEAVQVVRRTIKAGRCDSRTVRCGVGACRADGDWKGAVILIEEVLAAGVHVGPETYRIAIHACTEACPPEFCEAASIWRLQREQHFRFFGSYEIGSSSGSGKEGCVQRQWSAQELQSARSHIWRDWSRDRVRRLSNVVTEFTAVSTSRAPRNNVQGVSSPPDGLMRSQSDGSLTNNSEAMGKKKMTDVEAADALRRELKKAALVGKMPSFAAHGARAGYVAERLASRTLRVADFLALPTGPDEAGCVWVSEEVQRWAASSTTGSGTKKKRVVSLGGGPGFDHVSASLLCDFESLMMGVGNHNILPTDDEGSTHKRTSSDGEDGIGRDFGDGGGIETWVLDFEPGWEANARDLTTGMDAAWREAGSGKEELPAMNEGQSQKFKVPSHQHSWVFATADITKPLSDPENASVREALLVDEEQIAGQSGGDAVETMIWANYVVAENSVQLRETNFRFFTDLATQVSPRTMMVLTETSHRLWPDLCRCLTRAGGTWDVAFPRVSGKRGWAMCVRKKSSDDDGSGDKRGPRNETGVQLSPIQRQMIEVFEEDNKLHAERLRKKPIY